jgi:hypothetical protein
MPISSALGVSALFPAGFGFRHVIINGAIQVAQRIYESCKKVHSDALCV